MSHPSAEVFHEMERTDGRGWERYGNLDKCDLQPSLRDWSCYHHPALPASFLCSTIRRASVSNCGWLFLSAGASLFDFLG